jgi:predicted nucleic acid-binding protein
VGEGTFVVDASPLIFLASIDQLVLLKRLAGEVIVPAAVLHEVLAAKDLHPELAALGSAAWLRVEPDRSLPEEVAAWDLGAGEAQVLALALHHPSCEAVLDDLQARRCARDLGIPVLGTLGVILRAKRRGDIVAARPLVEELLRQGLYLSESLVRAALAEVEE